MGVPTSSIGQSECKLKLLNQCPKFMKHFKMCLTALQQEDFVSSVTHSRSNVLPSESHKLHRRLDIKKVILRTLEQILSTDSESLELAGCEMGSCKRDKGVGIVLSAFLPTQT